MSKYCRIEWNTHDNQKQNMSKYIHRKDVKEKPKGCLPRKIKVFLSNIPYETMPASLSNGIRGIVD
jgi:hypothetical protein